MASKQQELRTNIVLGGKIDSSLNALSAKLNEFNSLASKISQKIIQIGKESVEEYVNYEEVMKEVYSLGNYTYSDMEKLHQYNKEIAQTTTYTNKEAAEAELLLAQAGLDIEKTYQVLPSVMNLAMAGNLDMADSVDYLVSSLNALGLGMDSAQTLTDQMAKTAALGMTDIDTLGESLMRLGSASGMYFKDSTEILTILSAMSQFGKDMRGSQAGTQLRNFALSLAAPTSNIEEFAEAMRELGESEEDIEEFVGNRSNGIAKQAIGILEEAGLQIYDAQGNLLPMLDVIKSLRNAVKGNGDYTKDLEQFASAFAAAGNDVDTFVNATNGLSDNALFTLMSQIFGKRTASTALNLISISDEEWDATYQEIENSAGYAENAAEIMQGGLSGSLEKLDTAFSELKTTLGEYLAPDVQNVADFLHDIVVDVSNFDDETWNAIVSGMETFVGASAAVGGVAAAFKIIGSLRTVGGIGLAAAGLLAGASALNSIQESDFKDNFGDMELDDASLTQYINTLGTSFDTAYENVDKYNEALEKSIEDYKTASSTFSSDLMTAMLTQTTLTPEAQASLQQLGMDAYTAVVDGIANSTAATQAYYNMLFGGDGTAEYDPQYQDLIDLSSQTYQNALANAQEIGQELRDALTEAFADGKISEDEYSNILSYFNSYNDALSQAAAESEKRQEYIDLKKMLEKAQTLSFDELDEFSNEIETQRDERLAKEEEEFKAQYWGAEYDWDQAIENGWNVGGELATEERKRQSLEALEKAHKEQIGEISANYEGVLQRAWNSALESSDLGDAYSFIGGLADQVMNGSMSVQEAYEAAQTGGYGKNTYAGEGWVFNKTDERSQLSEYLAYMNEAFGGYEGILSQIEYYDSIGNSSGADFYRRLLTMQAINDNFNYHSGTSYQVGGELREDVQENYTSATGDENVYKGLQDSENVLKVTGIDHVAEEMSKTADELTDFNYEGFNDESIQFSTWNGRTLGDMIGEWGTGAWSKVKTAIGMGEDLTQNVDVTDDGKSNALRSEMESTFSSPITQYVDVVSGNVWGARTSNYVGSTSGTGKVRAKYAEGGRADTASIFGEAGPEWAIPEEHSRRTADLLNAARAASGFTWPELLSETGGLNAGNSRSVSLTYSPTIIANDATDVEAKLLQDKSRLERWMRDKQIRDEVEVYA